MDKVSNLLLKSKEISQRKYRKREMKNNLRKVDTCITCLHRLEYSDYDDSTQYFCNVEKLITREIFYLPKTKAEENFSNQWSENHRVNDNNVCDDFKEGDA
jgi:hypothetical protein